MNKDTRSIAIALVIMLCMAGSLFAAGQQAPAAAAKEVVTLEWWTWDSEEYDEAVQREMVKAFEAAHPGIKINMVLLPVKGFETKMTTALGAGVGGPDVAFFSISSWFPKAMNLGPYIERDKFDTSMYYKGFWDTKTQFNGTTIGLPLGVGAQFVMFNKNLFDAAGVKYPTNDWTTADYLETAKKVANPARKIWGCEILTRPFRAIWYNYGEKARLYSMDSTTVEGYLNSKESLAAYEWFHDLMRSGATPSVSDMATLSSENTGPVDLFMANRLAMATLNQGHMLNAVKAGMNFGVVREPGVGNNPRHVNAWSLLVGIWEGTKHPEEAWTFLKWYVGPEGQKFLMDNGNLFPSIDAVGKQYKDADKDYVKAFLEILDDTQVAIWRGAHPSGTRVEAQLTDLWDKIKLGLIQRNQIKAELDSLVPKAQAALEEAKKTLHY
jgi:multiple sugar transport system substrate-binding protein